MRLPHRTGSAPPKVGPDRRAGHLTNRQAISSRRRWRADDAVGLGAGDDRGGERGVGRLVREVLLAGEEPQEGSALLCRMIANRPAQHRVAGLERVKDRALCDGPRNVELHLGAGFGQVSQVIGQYDSDHARIPQARSNCEFEAFSVVVVLNDEDDEPAPEVPPGGRNLLQGLHLDRHHGRKIANDRCPVVSAVSRYIHLSAGRAPLA